jgi:hypothetical protein
VACRENISIVDVSTQNVYPFSSTPQVAWYYPHALALSDNDTVLVAGNAYSPGSVCGFDTASLTRLWIYKTIDSVGAVCMLGALVLVTVYKNPTLMFDCKTGEQIALLQTADGDIRGLGVIEGLSHPFFLIFSSSQNSTPLCTSP